MKKGDYLRLRESLTHTGLHAEASFTPEIDRADVFSQVDLHFMKRAIRFSGIDLDSLVKIPAEVTITRSVSLTKGE